MVNEKVIIKGLNEIIEKEISSIIENLENDNLENIIKEKIIKLIKVGAIAGRIDEDYETCFKIVTSKEKLDEMMVQEILKEVEELYLREN
ncbi:MAG: hypothetical protein ACRC4X_04155 [Cetobacterium sp.]